MGLVIDAYCSQPQYANHLVPVWQALPDELRGSFSASGNAARRLAELGVRPGGSLPRQRGMEAPMTLVASFQDETYVRPRPVVLVEHGAGQCLAPETRVLTADLRWVACGDLEVGDRLLAFDEERQPGKARRMRVADVLATNRFRRPCYRLHIEDGTKFVASAEHLWLKVNRGTADWRTTDQLKSAAVYPQRASRLVKVCDVWDDDRSWGAGYLAAAYDGEGHLSQQRRDEPGIERGTRCQVFYAQKPNAMSAVVQEELTRRGFRWSNYVKGSGVGTWYIKGGRAEKLRFLGQVRPRRLLAQFQPEDLGALWAIDRPRVMESEWIGEQEVVGLITSTGTLIAEGFATHNSYYHNPQAERNPHYPGGKSREGVVLFICPNESVAQRWRDMYPHTPTAVVGSPFLDPWHRSVPIAGPDRFHGELPLVVFSFHWDCAIVPECGWAFPDFQGEMLRLAAMEDVQRGFRMGGHYHPRAHAIGAFWRSIGVREFRNFSDVLDYADCYVVDNSSTGFEFASTDRPVVWMNSRRYRKDVEHGLRFWSHVDVGRQVDDPSELQATVCAAIEKDHSGRWAARRRELIKDVISQPDGHAAERAAAAIVAEYEAGHWRVWREERMANDPFAPTGRPILGAGVAAVLDRMRELGRSLTPEQAERLRGASQGDLEAILAGLQGE